MKENLVFSPNGQASIVVDAKTAKAAIELGLVRPNGDSLFASSWKVFAKIHKTCRSEMR